MHTRMRLLPPLTTALTAWRFGSNRRALTLFAWLCCRPTTGPFPHNSHRFAINALLSWGQTVIIPVCHRRYQSPTRPHVPSCAQELRRFRVTSRQFCYTPASPCADKDSAFGGRTVRVGQASKGLSDLNKRLTVTVSVMQLAHAEQFTATSAGDPFKVCRRQGLRSLPQWSAGSSGSAACNRTLVQYTLGASFA